MLDGLMTMFLSPYQTSAARPEEILYNRENIFSVRLPADWQEHQQVIGNILGLCCLAAWLLSCWLLIIVCAFSGGKKQPVLLSVEQQQQKFK